MQYMEREKQKHIILKSMLSPLTFGIIVHISVVITNSHAHFPAILRYSALSCYPVDSKLQAFGLELSDVWNLKSDKTPQQNRYRWKNYYSHAHFPAILEYSALSCYPVDSKLQAFGLELSDVWNLKSDKTPQHKTVTDEKLL